MTEKKSYKAEDYESSYEWRRECLWRDVSDQDDEGYANIISFFCKRSAQEKQQYSSVEFKPHETLYNKSYDVQLVIRLIRDKMMTKKLTRCPDGVKRRLTMRKEFLAMKPYEVYPWVSLQEEVRYAVRNNEESILLSYEEERMIY